MSQQKSANLLIGLGVIWLILALGLVIYQSINTPSIQIEWETATELNAAGFQLYRSTTPDGQFTLLTQELIPSTGSAVSGGSYSFTDTQIEPGIQYYYLLEEVENDGTAIRFSEDIISRSVNPFGPQIIGLIILITIAGLVLIGLGIREKKAGTHGTTTA
jgi:hypothetical protein